MDKNKAMFFDRDGIVNQRIIGDYVKKAEELNFMPYIFETIEAVKRSGYMAILVTNQQGVGKGVMTEEDLHSVHDFMQKTLFTNSGYRFDDIYYCPELASANSYYRKPNPGMLRAAIDKWNIDPTRSYMVGDSKTDIEAGINASLATVLISPSPIPGSPAADYTYSSLREFIDQFRKNGIII